MKRCKLFLTVFFSLFSLFVYAQQAKVEVTNDPCGSCKASTNGVQCGRCGSPMRIDRENVVTNPITKKTTYSYALKCPKDNHSMSCRSNARIASNPSVPNGKVYCPVCKKELDLIYLYVWQKCQECDGRGYYPDGTVCGYCKQWREIGKAGKSPELMSASFDYLFPVWRCFNCKPYRTFTLELKIIETRTFKGIEWVE